MNIKNKNNNTNNSIFVGNMYGIHLHDGYAGSVFCMNGVSPIITTCQGGNRIPMIIIEYDDIIHDAIEQEEYNDYEQ